MSEILSWEAPPPFKRGKRISKFQPIIDQLKENPNEWALVMEDVNAASAKVLTSQGIKVTTRSTGEDTGRVNVWAIFIDEGEGDEDEEEAVEVKAAPKKRASAARKKPSKK